MQLDLTKVDFAQIPTRNLKKELFEAQLICAKEIGFGKTKKDELKPMTWKEFLAVAGGVS
jgi:hypothetical protein